MFIEHPLLRKDSVEHREFQVNIAKECLSESTLVVLPTGLGKTVVALLVIADVLMKKGGRILFMAPTKPLVDQHAAFLRKNLLIESVSTFTGEMPPDRRVNDWKSARIIVSTPQVVENDIDSGTVPLKDFSLLIFDEAHRAVGDYSYVRIGGRYTAENDDPLVLGMTASPGYDLDKVAEVCRNLGISNIAVRSELDEDVAPYVYGIAIEFAKVDVPEDVDEITALLQKILDEKIQALRKYHVLDPKKPPNTRALLEAGNVLRAKIASNRKNYHLYRALTIQACAIKVNHAIDLARMQGIESLKNYIARIVEDAQTKGGSRASRDLVKDARFEMVRRKLDSGITEHPKLDKVKEIVQQEIRRNPKARIIVFTHYRDTSEQVCKMLSDLPDIMPVRFVGQAKKGADSGLNQKEQKEIIERFKKGEFNVLVATSVAEEGLDIPSTDLVVFYEPIPSEIRTIQRRGRTGRHRPGRVVVVLARRTKDEAFNYSSKRKEQKMRLQLEMLSRKLRIAKQIGAGETPGIEEIIERMPEEAAAERRAQRISKDQTLLSDFGAVASSGLGLRANADRNEDVLRELKSIGIEFNRRKGQLEDFVIGDEIAIIRESVDDFLADIDRRNIQAKVSALSKRFKRNFMIVEGKAVRKAEIPDKLPVFDVLVSLIRDLGIPVVATSNASDSAAFIASLVKSEMRKGSKEKTDSPDLTEYQMRMIQGLPNVTSILAERLLQRFGSVRGILCASAEELMQVEGIGRVIAEGIRRIATEKFSQKQIDSTDYTRAQ
ncbi:MAG: DEAD/DEAH box helicase [Thermoplasmata archaeon]